MAITPTQERYLDPFADIYSDKVDKRLMALYPDGKGLIYGLHLHEDGGNPSNLIIDSGVCIKDYVTLVFTNTENYDVSALSDGNYYVIVDYTYVKTNSPVPEATYDIVSAGSVGSNIVLGQIDISSGQVVNGSIDYTNRSLNALIHFLNTTLGEGNLTSNIDINNFKLTNLGNSAASITDPLDAANKIYVDTAAGGVTDTKVKIDTNDSTPDMLDPKLQVGSNLTKQILDDDFSSADPGNNHILYLQGDDNKLMVISGDSNGIFL